MAPPLPRPLPLSLALVALAVLSLISSFGDAEAACVVQGNLNINGIDCLVFDPATPTTIVAQLTDPNLGQNVGGNSYLQVGFKTNFTGPVNDIGFRANNKTTYQLFSPTNDILSTPSYSYTSINQFYSTNPSYVQCTIPGGNVIQAGNSYQLVLLTNTDGLTGSDGQLIRGLGNFFAAIPRDFESIPVTSSPTGTPTTSPMPRPTSAPTIQPTAPPTGTPTVSTKLDRCAHTTCA